MIEELQKKSERIARMMIQGKSDAEIAQVMGMSVDGLKRIKRCRDFLHIEYQVRKGEEPDIDERLKRRIEMEMKLEDAMPLAMDVLIERLKKKDLKAAIEVFERDPAHQFSKVSRADANNKDTSPAISTEALSSALKDADLTHKIIKQAASLENQKPAEA